MKKYKIILLLFLIAPSLQAQVKIFYEKQLIGKMEVADIGAIQVSNYTGVDIDYIYKGWALNEKGEKVLEIKSKVLTQPRGATNYYQKDKFDSWKKGDLDFKIISQSIDPSSFSGSLTFHSDLLHPIDTTSIIARQTKEVFLKNGMYVSESGAPVTDPRLVNFDFNLAYNSKFSLDSLFEKMKFKNQNEAECCLSLDFEITQEGEKIYASKAERFCVPVGTSKMSKEEIKALTVSINNYDQRNENTPIMVSYRLGESSGKRKISNIAHSNFDFSFDQYIHHASGLSFDFINHAEVTSPFSASSFAVIFDENAKMKTMQMLNGPGSANQKNLEMHHPFSCTLGREDFNGNVSVTTLRKDNFSDLQWKGLLANINKVDPTSLLSFKYEELTILAPKKLINPRSSEASNRIYKGYAFLIMDQESVTIYDAYYFSVPADFPRKPISDSLDIGKALASIAYNGIELDFIFDNAELKDLKFNVGKVLSQTTRKNNFEKMRRYHYLLNEWPNDQNKSFYQKGKTDFEKLDQIIGENNISEMSAIPTYVVVSPGEVKFLKYESLQWDSIGLQLSYRAEEKAIEIASNRIEEYDYKEKYKIETSAYMGRGVDFSYKIGEASKGDKNVMRFSSDVLEIRPKGQRIELSRLNDVPKDAEWLKSIVRYHNLVKRNDPVDCKVFEVQGWKIYVPVKKIKKTRWQKETICFLVDSGKQIYRINLSASSSFDRDFILNSLQIEDKQFQFDFKGDNLERITIQK